MDPDHAIPPASSDRGCRAKSARFLFIRNGMLMRYHVFSWKNLNMGIDFFQEIDGISQESGVSGKSGQEPKKSGRFPGIPKKKGSKKSTFFSFPKPVAYAARRLKNAYLGSTLRLILGSKSNLYTFHSPTAGGPTSKFSCF